MRGLTLVLNHGYLRSASLKPQPISCDNMLTAGDKLSFKRQIATLSVLDHADCLSVGKWTYPQAEQRLPAPGKKQSQQGLAHTLKHVTFMSASAKHGLGLERDLCA